MQAALMLLGTVPEVDAVITALVARRAGVREVWLFGSLARRNALRRPMGVLLRAAEWRAPEGTALYREVVMHGIRFHLPS